MGNEIAIKILETIKECKEFEIVHIEKTIERLKKK